MVKQKWDVMATTSKKNGGTINYNLIVSTCEVCGENYRVFMQGPYGTKRIMPNGGLGKAIEAKFCPVCGERIDEDNL
jgi:rRNA maturation endonuclease Nob1